jgi:hypothetical protein
LCLRGGEEWPEGDEGKGGSSRRSRRGTQGNEDPPGGREARGRGKKQPIRPVYRHRQARLEDTGCEAGGISKHPVEPRGAWRPAFANN